MFSLVFGEKVAVVASFLAAISRYLALYSVHVRSESAYFFFSCLVLFLVLSGQGNNLVWRSLLAGVVGGYAFLVRPEALGFLVLIPLYPIILFTTTRGFGLGQVSKSITALCIGFLLFALPYVVYLSIDTGQIGTISRKAGVTLAINLQEDGYLASDDLPNQDDVGSLVFTDYLRRHPVQYLQKIISDLPEATWTFLKALYFPFIPFLAVGLYLVFRERFWQRSDCLLLGFVLFYVYGFALFYVKLRYVVQTVPIALGWVALGILWLWDYLRQKLLSKQATIVAFSIGVVLLGATLPKTLKPISLEKAYVRESGLYLRNLNKTGDLRIAALDDRVAFYARAKSVLLNSGDSSNLADQLHEQRANYLVGETAALNRFHAGLTENPQKVGLLLEKTFPGTRNDLMLVFKVF